MAAPDVFILGIGTSITLSRSFTATPAAIIFTGSLSLPDACNTENSTEDTDRNITPIPSIRNGSTADCTSRGRFGKRRCNISGAREDMPIPAGIAMYDAVKITFMAD
jgi:hypothetical protein